MDKSTGDGVSRLQRELVRPRTRGEMVLGGKECATRLRIAPLSTSCNASEDRLVRASCCWLFEFEIGGNTGDVRGVKNVGESAC